MYCSVFVALVCFHYHAFTLAKTFRPRIFSKANLAEAKLTW